MKLNLPNEITLNVPGPNGTTVSRAFASFAVTLVDSESAKRVQAFLPPIRNGITLWSGAEYVAKGAYTQQEVASRIFEILGEDWEAGIRGLIPPATTPNT